LYDSGIEYCRKSLIEVYTSAMAILHFTLRLLIILLFILTIVSNTNVFAGTTETADPAEILVGERLFLETRFAHAYYANKDKPDPVMNISRTTGADLTGPFAGRHMNCRACHMVDEHADNMKAGMRSYADFASRPPIPSREDGKQTAPRNSQQLVNAAVLNDTGMFFHFDGQFATMTGLVTA